MSTTPAVEITPEQQRQFHEEGYFILERILSDEDLEMLRRECQRFMDLTDKRMDEAGTDVMGITHRGKRYFMSGCHQQSDELRRFLLTSPLMADICRATIGDRTYLFVNQYVVKCAEVGMTFSWHQDSGYIGHPHTPYLSCWIALDDMSEENGTVYILPYSRAGTRQMQQHRVQEGTNDKVGYFGDNPGIPVICPAGSIAVFSSTTFHRSSANTTKQPRRVYLAQYAPEVIMNRDGTAVWGLDIPFLKDGKIVGHEHV